MLHDHTVLLRGWVQKWSAEAQMTAAPPTATTATAHDTTVTPTAQISLQMCLHARGVQEKSHKTTDFDFGFDASYGRCRALV
mmetsp:Transcript_48271/g.86862  ORF Transcript_48271/g.86862 Transcript_48271/m.86862 type:complete len:82 (+) Transcript_48271:102-347(+)